MISKISLNIGLSLLNKTQKMHNTKAVNNKLCFEKWLFPSRQLHVQS